MGSRFFWTIAFLVLVGCMPDNEEAADGNRGDGDESPMAGTTEVETAGASERTSTSNGGQSEADRPSTGGKGSVVLGGERSGHVDFGRGGQNQSAGQNTEPSDSLAGEPSTSGAEAGGVETHLAMAGQGSAGRAIIGGEPSIGGGAGGGRQAEMHSGGTTGQTPVNGGTTAGADSSSAATDGGSVAGGAALGGLPVGGITIPSGGCGNVECGARGACRADENGRPACVCDRGFVDNELTCQADPVSVTLEFIDARSEVAVPADALESGRAYIIKMVSVPAGREDELEFTDDDFVIFSPFGASEIGEIDRGVNEADGEIMVIPSSPGRIDVLASAVWIPDGRGVDARATAIVGLIDFTPGAEIIERTGYSLTNTDPVRVDQAEIPNVLNIEYIPLRFDAPGPVAFAVTPIYTSITRSHYEPLGRRIWRSPRLSLHDSAGRTLVSSHSDLASSYLNVSVESGPLYYLGVSHYAVCSDGDYNYDRAIGLDIPMCGADNKNYLSRDDVQFDYTLAMGTIEDYSVGTDLIDSLSNTDMPTPEFQNNYFDFYRFDLEEGQTYEWRYRPTRVGADVMPLLKILSDTPGHPGYMISATPPDQAPERIPMLYGIFRAQTGGRHHLAVLNNQAILNPGLGVAYGFSIKPIADERTLTLGRPAQFLLGPDSPRGYAIQNLEDQRPLELIALPDDLEGRYRIRVSAGVNLLVGLVGHVMQNDMINSPIRNLDILEVDPGQPINEVVVDIKQGQYTGLALTVPLDRIGEFIVTVQMDQCGDDGCNACDSVRCDDAWVDGQLTRAIGGECSIDDNRRAQCTCPDGFTQSEALIPLASCAQICPNSIDCGGHGTCVPTYTGPLCLCDQGYVLDPSNREVCLAREQLSCSAFFTCYMDCMTRNNNRAEQCGRCYATLTEQGRRDLTAFRQCVIDNRCPTQSGQPRNQCINAHCVDQAAACSQHQGPTPVRSTTVSGRDGGGNPNDDLCQFGEVLIGLQGAVSAVSGYLVQLNGLCGRPRVDANGDVSVSVTGPLPIRGDGNGLRQEARCPAGEVIVAARGRRGDWIDRIQIQCAPLTNNDGQFVPAQSTIRGGIGGNGGQIFSEITCPAGEVATGVFSRTSNAVHAFAFLCDTLQSPRN